MKTFAMLMMILLLLAAPAWSQEPDLTSRPWGFGWDGSPTLRRQLGRWQLAVTAGPDDNLSDSETLSFGPDLPDSVQGLLTDGDHSKRESGHVRLDVLREVARQDNLVFFGLFGSSYQWSDYESGSDYYYYRDEGYRLSRESGFWDRWSLLLGGRLAWYPVPFVSLETDFGVVLSWYNRDSVRQSKDPDETEWNVDHRHNHEQDFDSFGFYDLTTGMNLVVWF